MLKKYIGDGQNNIKIDVPNLIGYISVYYMLCFVIWLRRPIDEIWNMWSLRVRKTANRWYPLSGRARQQWQNPKLTKNDDY